MTETKEVTITNDKDVLIVQRNSFQKQLIDNILDYRRHLTILEIDPDYQRQDPQTRQITTIEELVKGYQKAALSAREYVKIIDELLKADEAGTLAEAWSNIEGATPTEGEEAEA